MTDQQPSPALISFMASEDRAPNATAYPWLSQSTQTINDPILRMHNELIQFSLWINMLPEELARLQIIYTKLKDSFEGNPSVKSTCAPLLQSEVCLAGTGVEIYVVVENGMNLNVLSLQSCLIKAGCSGISFRTYSEENSTGPFFECDCEDQRVTVRILGTDLEDYLSTIPECFEQIPEFRHVYLLIACMIRQRGLHLQLTPLLVFGLIAVFYYERRKQRSRTLTENVLKFIEYFGVGSFHERKISYQTHNRYEIFQQGPTASFSFWVSQQTNVSSPLVRQLFALFKNRYRIISNYNFAEEVSIVGWLVNPCAYKFSYL